LTDEKGEMEIIILSNNPDVWKFYPDAVHVEGDPRDVMKKARDLIHQGWGLFTHPFHGNMRLLKNPYRSLVLKYEEGVVNADSIICIEESLYRLDSVNFDTSEGSRPDYRYIDLDLLQSSFSG